MRTADAEGEEDDVGVWQTVRSQLERGPSDSFDGYRYTSRRCPIFTMLTARAGSSTEYSLAEPVLLKPGQLLAARGTGITGQVMDPADDPPSVCEGEGFEFLGGRALDPEVIACHGASGFSRPPRSRG